MKSTRSQRGQGTTEYLLVLFLSVAIILGAITQLNTAFRSWADNYFGEYLTCLLETGELPTLSGGSSGECDGAFQPFSLAAGRPALGNAIGEGGNDSSDGSGEQEGQPPPSATAGADAGDESSTSISRGGLGRSGARSRVRSSSSVGSDEDGSSKSDQSGQGTFNTYDQGGRIVRIPIRETDAIRKRRYAEDQKDKQRTKARTDKPLSGEEREGAPVLMKNKTRKIAAEEVDDSFEWSFGNLLRILIILAILIAILLFLGGQALQVTKSLD
jgi:hypothetical protein